MKRYAIHIEVEEINGEEDTWESVDTHQMAIFDTMDEAVEFFNMAIDTVPVSGEEMG